MLPRTVLVLLWASTSVATEVLVSGLIGSLEILVVSGLVLHVHSAWAQAGISPSRAAPIWSWWAEDRCDTDEFVSFFVSPTGSNDKNSGRSPETPYMTINYAVRNRARCSTIHVMDGTYFPDAFGESETNSKVIVDLTGVTNLKLVNLEGHHPILKFDGAAAIIARPTGNQYNIEISGLEIVGMSEELTWKDAMDRRISKPRLYNGKGISFVGGHHIYMHHLKVHHCPSSGMRVNKGDYIIMSDNEVYNNTFWTASASSAMVLAESTHIDKNSNVKMLMTRNLVYGNVNKIPFYNPKHAWDYSPIANGIDCSVTACECTVNSPPECIPIAQKDCPHQCRYGKISQDYIIDGQGVYVTRNSDTYLYGIMELSENTCYGNGINGISYHRTDRGIIKKNRVFANGVVPRLDKSEEVVEDWHQGAAGKSRQPYSGIVINNAKDIWLWGNKVMARYKEDLAFVEHASGGRTGAVINGGNNKACRGRITKSLTKYMKPVKKETCMLPCDGPNSVPGTTNDKCLCSAGAYGDGFSGCTPCPSSYLSASDLPGNGGLASRCHCKYENEILVGKECVCRAGTWGSGGGLCESCPLYTNPVEFPGNGLISSRCRTCNDEDHKMLVHNICVCKSGFHGNAGLGETCTPCPHNTVPVPGGDNGAVLARCRTCDPDSQMVYTDSCGSKSCVTKS